MSEVADLERRIAALPSGYISEKSIRGRKTYYYQYRVDGRLKSKYINRNDLENLRERIAERKALQKELEYLLIAEESRKSISPAAKAVRLNAYAKKFYQGCQVPIGEQDYETLISRRLFYIDKTDFIKKWWLGNDRVTLITRPRRFGKTLTLSMVECFFSCAFEHRMDLFSGLAVANDPGFCSIQGTYPVIRLSFAPVKDVSHMMRSFAYIIRDQYAGQQNLLHSELLNEADKEQLLAGAEITENSDLASAIHNLCRLMKKHYGRRVIVLLDEYDTPMHEAWLNGTWSETVAFIREFFNYTFKNNPYLERALITGITRVSKNSVFSDLNNLRVVTTRSDRYANCFGFTETEVFETIDEQFSGTPKERQLVKNEVKRWYDGFTFGESTDIYNPWSITCFLADRKFEPYWVNTSDNSLIGSLLAKGSVGLKQNLEKLVKGEAVRIRLQEDLIFERLEYDEDAVWSFLLAAGYLRICKDEDKDAGIRYGTPSECSVKLTNSEVTGLIRQLIRDWFGREKQGIHEFQKSLLRNDIDGMVHYLNRIALSCFSVFDTAAGDEGLETERFYHGFILGLLVELEDRYVIRSNRESGFGRYDVMLWPIDPDCADRAFILEFKIFDPRKEKNLVQTAERALQQIRDRMYAEELKQMGIEEERISMLGIGFRGKEAEIAGCLQENVKAL